MTTRATRIVRDSGRPAVARSRLLVESGSLMISSSFASGRERMKVQTMSGVNFGKFVFLSVLVVMLLAIPLAAQLPTGTILGVVKDASGGVVPGATITATNVDNAQALTATSGSDGAFRFSSMPVGHYNVKIEASGFKTTIQACRVVAGATGVCVNPVL